MRIRDSRRLTGPNLLTAVPGAVIDARLAEGEDSRRVIQAWERAARRILDAVGWGSEILAKRSFPGGVSLAFTAPIDALYAATEVNDWAFAAGEAALAGKRAPSLAEARSRLAEMIAAERDPALIALARAAESHGVAFFADRDLASVGLGKGGRSFSIRKLPRPTDIDWQEVHDVPVVLVTGTNGKSTSVRLLAAIAAAAGFVPGIASSDGVHVASEMLLQGDYSGPEGARAVLRDARVEVACLETARGGILRRGLAVRRADAALITNVAEDHLGEFGIHDLEALIEVKLVVTRVVGRSGRVVLNADDENLRARGREIDAPVTWFTMGKGTGGTFVAQHASRAGGRACTIERGVIEIVYGGERERVASIDDVPILLGGAARHNVENVLGVVGAADAIDLPIAAMAKGLGGFESTPEANPGRANFIEMGGVRMLVDFAHNPHGMEALVEMVRVLPRERLLVLIGQAGDRSDEAIRELARITWRLQPDRVVLKDLSHKLRGRAAGEVPALMERELRRLGAPLEAIDRAGDEMDGVRRALSWARGPGDLLVLTIHEDRTPVFDLLETLQTRAWHAGERIEPGTGRS